MEKNGTPTIGVEFLGFENLEAPNIQPNPTAAKASSFPHPVRA